MEVWQAREPDAAKPLPSPTIAGMSKVTISGEDNGDAINDQFEPKNSNDQPVPFVHWWPHKGTVEWVQYDFVAPVTVSSVEVYWFVDAATGGGCRAPQSWRILYRDGEEWKPVQNNGEYTVALDQYNRVEFKPVRTGALRLEVELPPTASSGILEWRVK